MPDIIFNPDQVAAIEQAVQWYRDFRDGKTKKIFFALGGYAGTGKTTVARHIANLCAPPTRVKYIAPTGKAAARLRDKGCVGAETVHRFLYDYLGSDFYGDPEFQTKASLDEAPLLIICDEASMIGERMGGDIISKRIPVLFLGDLGQAEPVGDAPFLDPEDFSVNMTNIERNKGNIVRASFYVRTGGRLPAREYDDVKVYDRRYTMNDIENHIGEDSVMLCSRNSTRQLLNHKARIVLRVNETLLPEIGEKVICTFNQRKNGIYNGEQFILESLRQLEETEMSDTDDEFMMMAGLRSLSNGEKRTAKFNSSCFIAPTEDQRYAAYRKLGGFDFGYALTIHKSQGSEWPRVMLLEETLKNTSYARLQYTGITRAIDHLTVFRGK